VLEEGRIQLEQCGDTSAPVSYHSIGHQIELRYEYVNYCSWSSVGIPLLQSPTTPLVTR
jgi:hypothetical protein